MGGSNCKELLSAEGKRVIDICGLQSANRKMAGGKLFQLINSALNSFETNTILDKLLMCARVCMCMSVSASVNACLRLSYNVS